MDDAARRSEQARIARLQAISIAQEEFLGDLRTALEDQQPYGAGRLGGSPEYWLYYSALIAQGRTNDARLLRPDLPHNFHNQDGLFPIELDFICQYADFYGQHLRQLDSVGICHAQWEWEVLEHYGLYPNPQTKLIYYTNQEPNRSSPNREDLCYLPGLRDKKVLLICPFAGLLASRANKETFEGVWAKTGKPWFGPASVDALEFPYGFVQETQARYGNAIELFESIAEETERRDFDVALVAAAGLGTPIVSHIRQMGKVAIYLGGHLQILFGVLGKRWRERGDWREMYFTPDWIDMPDAYKPKELEQGLVVCDDGAYW